MVSTQLVLVDDRHDPASGVEQLGDRAGLDGQVEPLLLDRRADDERAVGPRDEVAGTTVHEAADGPPEPGARTPAPSRRVSPFTGRTGGRSSSGRPTMLTGCGSPRRARRHRRRAARPSGGRRRSPVRTRRTPRTTWSRMERDPGRRAGVLERRGDRPVVDLVIVPEVGAPAEPWPRGAARRRGTPRPRVGARASPSAVLEAEQPVGGVTVGRVGGDEQHPGRGSSGPGGPRPPRARRRRSARRVQRPG